MIRKLFDFQIRILFILGLISCLPKGLLAQAQAEDQARTDRGGIIGRLVLGGSTRPKSSTLDLHTEKKAKEKEAFSAGEPGVRNQSLVVDPKTRGVRFGFAFLVSPRGNFGEATERLKKRSPEIFVDFERRQIVPHCVGILGGQTLLVRNRDLVDHEPWISPIDSSYGQVFTGFYPGDHKKYDFQDFINDTHPMHMHCIFHPEESGWLRVFDHPFFTVTGQDGSFEIRDVPSGEQFIQLWHEKKGWILEGRASGMKVTVQPGKTLDLGEVELVLAK